MKIRIKLTTVSVLAAGLTSFSAQAATVSPHYHLSSVASFEHQLTGVAVSHDQRVFVNFPRWSEDAPISVGEVLPDGSVRAYPDAAWNAWRNAKPLSPSDHFVCVQALYADHQGALWVVDPAAPNTEKIIAGGPKIVKIDLATNKVARIFAIGPDVAPEGSYLNDIRITPDGKWGVLTDSGRGALVVINLESGKASRLLDGEVSTKGDPNVILKVDGKPLLRPDGRSPEFAADGLAMDAKGEFVYWQALRGAVLYRLPMASISDEAIQPAALNAQVQVVQPTHPADGLWLTAGGLLFSTDFTDNSVKVRTIGQPPTIAVQDPRLRWPDSFAEGPDGALYVTTSHIQDSPWFHSTGSVRTEPYGLWRITAD